MEVIWEKGIFLLFSQETFLSNIYYTSKWLYQLKIKKLCNPTSLQYLL